LILDSDYIPSSANYLGGAGASGTASGRLVVALPLSRDREIGIRREGQGRRKHSNFERGDISNIHDLASRLCINKFPVSTTQIKLD
jgi:hypothetical protein